MASSVAVLSPPPSSSLHGAGLAVEVTSPSESDVALELSVDSASGESRLTLPQEEVEDSTQVIDVDTLAEESLSPAAPEIVFSFKSLLIIYGVVVADGTRATSSALRDMSARLCRVPCRAMSSRRHVLCDLHLPLCFLSQAWL